MSQSNISNAPHPDLGQLFQLAGRQQADAEVDLGAAEVIYLTSSSIL